MSSLMDLWRSWLNGFSASDLSAYNEVTSAGADSQLLTIKPSAGTYDVTIYVNFAGTTGAQDRPNLSLRKGPASGSNNAATTELLRFIGTMNSSTDEFRTRITLNGSEHVQIRAIAAATASAVYRASILFKRVV